MENRRRYFRLSYPAAERPTLRWRGHDYKVVEISEGGIKVQAPEVDESAVGRNFAGVIRFKDGGTAALVGVVVRAGETEMVVQLSKRIDFRRMLIEQRRVRQKYPVYFERQHG